MPLSLIITIIAYFSPTDRFRNFFYLFKSLKHILNYKLKKLTYISLIQSIISYGVLFWGGARTIHNTSLQPWSNAEFTSKIHF
jgi:hypothetical protein